jgi:hypothetical protein
MARCHRPGRPGIRYRRRVRHNGVVPGIAKRAPASPLLPRTGTPSTRLHTFEFRKLLLCALADLGGTASTDYLGSRVGKTRAKELGRLLAALRQLGYVEHLGIARGIATWRLTKRGRRAAAE